MIDNALRGALVVGADGKIGGALVADLKRAGRAVRGTVLDPRDADEDRDVLDLAGPPESWACPSAEVAYLCAAVTRLEDCRRDPERAFRVNVEGTCGLARRLVGAGAFVVFLSSNEVLDGHAPLAGADDPVCPATEYGRQKAEAERRLLALGGSVAVVRLTKVLGSGFALFAQWAAAMKAGRAVHPFSDRAMAPVPLAFVVAALRGIGERRLAGIWQVSGERDVSYAEAARLGARALGLDEDLVQPVAAGPAGPGEPLSRLHTTLRSDRTCEALGLRVPAVDETIRTAFVDPAALDRL